MPPLTEYVNNGNVRRFLDMLSAAEGTDTHSYNTLFGGARFDSLAEHPRVSSPFTETTGRRNRSDASGRYGFLSSTWDEQAKKLGLKDFGPYSQDLAAINLLKEKGILPHVLSGEWDQAIQKAGPVWASLPSSPYPQPRRSREFVMARLNNANATTQAPAAQGPSIEAMMNAMDKAQAANDSNAVLEIQNLIKGRFTSARQKAEAAGDTNAVQEIDSRLQQIMSGQGTQAAPVPVAPPTEPQGTTLAPRVADALVDPQAAPVTPPMDPQAVPVAPPMDPQAVTAAPEPALTPAMAPAPQAAPAAPQSTAQLLGVPGAAPAAPVAPVAPKVTDAQMNSDPKWVANAKQIYKDVQGSDFSGSDAEAADWLKNYVAQTKWNMAGGATTIYDAMTKMSPESKQALLASIQMYGDAPTSMESVGRALKGIGTDPTTYLTLGLGNLVTKTVGKKLAQEGVKQVLESGIKNRLVSGATAQAAASGAGFGAANNLIDQGVQIAADGQEGIDPTKLAINTAVGAGAGAGVNKILEKFTGKAAVRDFGQRAGSEVNAAMDAEITKDLAEMAANSAKLRGGNPRELQAIDANDLARKYITQAEEAINKLDPQTREPLISALRNGRALNAEERNAVMATPGGSDVLNIVDKADRVRTLTGQMGSQGGVLGTVARQAVNLSPAYLSALAGYPVPVTVDMLKAITNKLGGKTTRAEAIAETLKVPSTRAANSVSDILGPSPAAQSIDSIRQMAAQAVTDRTARIEAAKQARASAGTKVEDPNALISELMGKDPTYLLSLNSPFGAPRNATEMGEFSKTLRLQMEARAAKERLAQEAAAAAKGANPTTDRNSILEATGMPLGGPFQELLQGGRSGLNLTSDQAVDALRIVSGKNRGNPLGTAADQIRKSSPDGVTSPDAFYGIQNEIRKLQERGVLGGQPGALTSVNPVRNPISYAANVRTAEAALKQATDAAPSNAMAQFANVVAGTKSPETKAKLVQQRLLKTTDPAEIQYLTDFIEPLTRFGAKSK